MTELRRVLVVDDEESVLFVLNGALAKVGNEYSIESHRASSGEDAISKAQELDFDLLITDIRLPGMNGLQLTKHIRSLHPKIGVVWITAYGCEQLRENAERLGVRRCLDKPLEIAQIRQAAREALDEARHEVSQGE